MSCQHLWWQERKQRLVRNCLTLGMPRPNFPVEDPCPNLKTIFADSKCLFTCDTLQTLSSRIGAGTFYRELAVHDRDVVRLSVNNLARAIGRLYAAEVRHSSLTGFS